MENKKTSNSKIKDFFSLSKSPTIQATKKSKNTIFSFFSKSYQMGQMWNSQSTWNPQLQNENSLLKDAFPKMVARSRDLHHNSPIAKKYVMMSVQNILGTKGPIVQVDAYDFVTQKNNGKNETVKIPDDVANNVVEEHFDIWGKRGNCDVTGSYNLKELFEVMIKSWKTDGEILYIVNKSKPSPSNPYGYQIQVLDSQRIDSLYYETLTNGNKVTQGIELDKFGRVVAYHLREYAVNNMADNYTGNYQENKRIRILKGDAELVFERIHPEQTRGIPPMAAVGKYIKELEDYNEATMAAAKMGAGMSIYLEREAGSDNSEFADGQEDDGSFFAKMGNSEIMTMPAGFKVNGYQGKFPSEVYAVYTKKMIQIISAGLNVSPLFLGNDTSDVNYSTSRTILAEERETWKKQQAFFVENVCSPIFEGWLKQSLLNSKITLNNGTKLPIEKFEKFKNHRFFCRTWAWIDPKNDAEATKTLIEMGLATKTQVCAENGQDYEDILRIKKKEQELEAKYNINTNIDSATSPTSPTAPTNSQDTNIVADPAVDPNQDPVVN